MAEDSEAGRGPDRTGPDAAHLAMNAASRGAADAYLAKNSRLVDLQIADMEREDRLRHWSLRVRPVIADKLDLTAAERAERARMPA